MTTLRILADFHHHDLWESLELLFERLTRMSDHTTAFVLYRPIGMEWYEQGYWNHERKWHGDSIAKQYLERWGSDYSMPNVVRGGDIAILRDDPSHPGRRYKLLTLDMARQDPPDIVISSLAHNHEGFARFASETRATFGLQVGNVRFSPIDMAEDRWDLASFGLVSGYMPAPVSKPHVVYHQEFAVPAYKAPPRRDPLVVASFVQCYPQDRPAYAHWLDAAGRAPELDWRVYGAYGEATLDGYAAGNIGVCADVMKAMQASDVAWHAKRWSDGFGHVIHSWFAAGRPLLGFRDYYRDQMAGALWDEGVNAFDIGSRSPDETVALLRRLRDDEDFHLRASEAARARFDQVVNFDEEAELIRQMFAQVLP